MKLTAMRFGGAEWHHNPREIEFECDRNIAELNAPFVRSYVQDTGRKNMVIKGVGELYGEDCLEQFNRLLSLFRQGGARLLSIPRLEPIFAVFESLKLEGKPKPDVITYSFVFREVMEKKHRYTTPVCVVGSGETLWDISYAYDTDIDTLVRLNPQIRRPDAVEDGNVVRIC